MIYILSSLGSLLVIMFMIHSYTAYKEKIEIENKKKVTNLKKLFNSTENTILNANPIILKNSIKKTLKYRLERLNRSITKFSGKPLPFMEFGSIEGEQVNPFSLVFENEVDIKSFSESTFIIIKILEKEKLIPATNSHSINSDIAFLSCCLFTCEVKGLNFRAEQAYLKEEYGTAKVMYQKIIQMLQSNPEKASFFDEIFSHSIKKLEFINAELSEKKMATISPVKKSEDVENLSTNVKRMRLQKPKEGSDDGLDLVISNNKIKYF